MKVAIRYYSRGGHVEAMAEALSRGTGVEAISIDEPGAEITEHVDLLFIGGALYGFRLDQAIYDFVEALDPEMVTNRAICFGSSYLTRRPIYILQDILKQKGITISPQAAYARNKPKELLLDSLAYFAETEINRDPDLDRLPPIQYMIRAEKRKKEEQEAREAAEAAALVAEAEAEAEQEEDELEADGLPEATEEVAADMGETVAEEAEEE